MERTITNTGFSLLSALILLLILISNSSLPAASEERCSTCPSGFVFLETQSQVDAFVAAYSDCATIEGHFVIDGDASLGDPITDLSGLSFIRSVTGDLTIRRAGSLTSLSGLEGLTSVGGNLRVSHNSLTSLSGLEGLTSVGGLLLVGSHRLLTSLNGLEALTSVGGILRLSNNGLTSLSGLEGLTSVLGDLFIESNRTLTDCCAISDLLNTPGAIGGSITIAGNSTGCDSQSEINSNCDADGDGVPDETDNCPDTPNPGQTDTDGDGDGDACDEDDDNDGVADASDPDPLDPSICGDSDGDSCDDCSATAANDFAAGSNVDTSNDGTDTDGDGLCDAGDPDDDNDGCLDPIDLNPLVASTDSDCDGVNDDCDNCPGGDDSGPCNAAVLPQVSTLPAHFVCPNNNNNEKIVICKDGNTMCVSENAANTHLANGGFLGPCTSCSSAAFTTPNGTDLQMKHPQSVPFKLYPNPTTGQLRLQPGDLVTQYEDVQLIVYNQIGQVVYRQIFPEFTAPIETLDLSHLQPGMYLVQLRAGKMQVSKKISVIR